MQESFEADLTFHQLLLKGGDLHGGGGNSPVAQKETMQNVYYKLFILNPVCHYAAIILHFGQCSKR